MTNPQVKTRFCPSPTGLIHLGNIRTALFSALYARNQGGTFLLRIEDTDAERSEERFTEQLQQDLHWLGLDWQEGPSHDAGLGPYFQSQRQAIYDDYYQRLEKAGFAYHCFCSEEELALTRKIQRSQGKPPRYPGTCRSLSDDEREAKLAQGLKPTLRFCVPDDTLVEFEDLVRGKQSYKTEDMGDFIIRRANGTSPFMFCNAIDDALMKVTHAIRGEDHLTNTPRQILILQALALPIPAYGHIALIVGADGSPLSKRHGSKSAVELRAEGYLPDAINNYLARLGHYYGHDHYLSLDELAAQFKTEALVKSPAKFNLEQLNFWQKMALEKLSAEAVWEWFGEEVRAQIPEEQRLEFIELIKPNIAFPKEALHWANILYSEEIVYGDAEVAILKQAGVDYFKVAMAAYAEHPQDFSAMMNHIKSKLDVKGKALFMPLRIALTGEQHGPELEKLLHILGPKEVRRRLETAL